MEGHQEEQLENSPSLPPWALGSACISTGWASWDRDERPHGPAGTEMLESKLSKKEWGLRGLLEGLRDWARWARAVLVGRGFEACHWLVP